MNDFATPLQANAAGLSDASPSTVLTSPVAAPVPASAVSILAAQQKPERSNRMQRHWMLYAGGTLLAAQIIMPHGLKPAVVAGTIAAGFYEQIMMASTNNQIQLAQQQALAMTIAQLQSDRADAQGKCALLQLLGPNAAQLCYSLVDQRYQTSLSEAKRALANGTR